MDQPPGHRSRRTRVRLGLGEQPHVRYIKPAFDEHIYVECHQIENLFARLKSFSRIATRYEKFQRTFAAMVSVACIFI